MAVIIDVPALLPIPHLDVERVVIESSRSSRSRNGSFITADHCLVEHFVLLRFMLAGDLPQTVNHKRDLLWQDN